MFLLLVLFMLMLMDRRGIRNGVASRSAYGFWLISCEVYGVCFFIVCRFYGIMGMMMILPRGKFAYGTNTKTHNHIIHWWECVWWILVSMDVWFVYSFYRLVWVRELRRREMWIERFELNMRYRNLSVDHRTGCSSYLDGLKQPAWRLEWLICG